MEERLKCKQQQCKKALVKKTRRLHIESKAKEKLFKTKTGRSETI